MAIVGALPGPGYIDKWVFSFAGVGRLGKHTVNSQFFNPQKKSLIQNYSEQRKQRDGKEQITGSRERAQWVRG